MFQWFKSRKSGADAPVGVASADPSTIVKSADVLREAGDHAGALELYEQALRIEPKYLYATYWAATLREQLGDLAAAAEFAERGLAIDPDDLGMLLRRGSIANAALDPARALACYQKVAQLDPEVPNIDGMLADQYCTMGRHAEGIAAFERALTRTPDSIALQSNRLFVLNYTTFMSPAELFEEHRRWGARHEARLISHRLSFDAHPDPAKRLRIGYVSPDLRDHPVALFVEPLLRAHDKAAFEIHCFDTSCVAEDHATARMKPHACAWHKVGDLGDEALAAMIRACSVDILVDLSGHTASNRLMVFAMRPAPVQVTWLGYLNTTGLTAIDYRLTDNYLDPAGTTEHFHTEKLLRVPNHACFSPAPDSPPVSPLPAARKGIFTYGSVNQWPKTTDAVKDAWAQILQRIECSRLIVVARGGQDAEFRDRIVADLVRRGARAGQIQVRPALSLPQFLRLFAEIDVTLDPFPYGGGTTTMQSLWMGVPVVTLAGATAFARNSVGALTEVGLGDLIATTVHDYVATATKLAYDLDALKRTRAALRERIAASPVVDGHGFAVNVERAMNTIWQDYCHGRNGEVRAIS